MASDMVHEEVKALPEDNAGAMAEPVEQTKTEEVKEEKVEQKEET